MIYIELIPILHHQLPHVSQPHIPKYGPHQSSNIPDPINLNRSDTSTMPSTLSTLPLLLAALLLSILSAVQGAPLSLPARTFIYSKQQIHIQLLHANHTQPQLHQKLPHQVTELENYSRPPQGRDGGVRLDDLLEAPRGREQQEEEVDVRVWMEGMRGRGKEEVEGYGELMVVRWVMGVRGWLEEAGRWLAILPSVPDEDAGKMGEEL